MDGGGWVDRGAAGWMDEWMDGCLRLVHTVIVLLFLVESAVERTIFDLFLTRLSPSEANCCLFSM